MVQKTTTKNNGQLELLLQDCAAALQNIARYKLPIAVDRRLLWLSENKETLTEAEKEELLALVDFSEDRTVEKLQAKVLLERLTEAWPRLFESKP